MERNAVNNSVTFADSVGSQPNAISFRSIVTATVPDGAGRGVPRIIADLVDQVGAHAAEAHARGADQAKHFSREKMMQRKYETEAQATEVLKEALWLAWVAAGGPRGNGVLRDNPSAQKEQVWDQAYNLKDYSGRGLTDGMNLNADYVFGRMLKLRIRRPDATTLEIPDFDPRPDYQSWCIKYPSFDALFDAAEKTKV